MIGKGFDEDSSDWEKILNFLDAKVVLIWKA